MNDTNTNTTAALEALAADYLEDCKTRISVIREQLDAEPLCWNDDGENETANDLRDQLYHWMTTAEKVIATLHRHHEHELAQLDENRLDIIADIGDDPRADAADEPLAPLEERRDQLTTLIEALDREHDALTEARELAQLDDPRYDD